HGGAVERVAAAHARAAGVDVDQAGFAPPGRGGRAQEGQRLGGPFQLLLGRGHVEPPLAPLFRGGSHKLPFRRLISFPAESNRVREREDPTPAGRGRGLTPRRRAAETNRERRRPKARQALGPLLLSSAPLLPLRLCASA